MLPSGTSAALHQLLAQSGDLLALWCPLLQRSYREELLRATGSLSHRWSPHLTCVPVVRHASAFPALYISLAPMSSLFPPHPLLEQSVPPNGT